jgi:hypothetical protein
MKLLKFGIVALLLCSGVANAGARDLYRNKRYAFIEMRVSENSQAAIKCVLEQVYAAKIQNLDAEKREIFKKGGKQLTLIHWGKDKQNSLEVEEAVNGGARMRLNGWYPSIPSVTGSFLLVEPCMAKGDGTAPPTVEYTTDKDNSIAGKIIGKIPYGRVAEFESDIERSAIIQCMAEYPGTLSRSYDASSYSPQLVAQENGAARLVWYHSGNFVNPPRPLYDYFLLKDFGGKRKVEVFLSRAVEGASFPDHWMVQLARSCSGEGNNDSVTSFPRHDYWKPTQITSIK